MANPTGVGKSVAERVAPARISVGKVVFAANWECLGKAVMEIWDPKWASV